MKQFDFQANKLFLKVRKTPLIIRVIFFAFAFAFFILPIISLIFSISNGNGLKFGHFIFMGAFGLMGFYLLRLSLCMKQIMAGLKTVKKKLQILN